MHFICSGECQGVSPVAKVCESENCSQQGEALVACDCLDNQHGRHEAETTEAGTND